MVEIFDGINRKFKKLKAMKIKKIITAICLFLILACIGTVIFSPFKRHKGFDYPLILHQIEINAPVQKVFTYLGNSDHARDWSVFVDHINTLNAEKVPDGQVGSERRCFVHANEKGTQWDEMTTEVIPFRKRQLTIYNLQGFPLTANHLATEQLYQTLPNGNCLLSFTVFYKDAPPTFFEKIKTHIASYRIKAIFKGNMENIKRIVESQNS